MSQFVRCFDCGYEKRCSSRGGVSARQSANASKAGHLNREGCERAVVLDEREQWWFENGWVPATVTEPYHAALRARIDELDRRITEIEFDHRILALEFRLGARRGARLAASLEARAT